MRIPVRDLMRVIHRSKILEIVRTNDMISRIDLARSSGLSQSLITGLTADLIKEGLIIEKQSGKYQGGRRPMLLALNPEGAFIVGVNLSVSEISVVIVNFAGTIVASNTLPMVPDRHNTSEISDNIASAVQACIWEANFTKEQIKGVGIGVPGLVNPDSGIIRFMPNFNLENVNLKELVQIRLNHSCYIDNNSNILALAEQWFGKGKGVDNFLVITIANGVGLGAVINGRLYRGEKGISGEFGHMTIDPNGPKCHCGKRGCIEAYIGKVAIMRDARQAALTGQWEDCSDPDGFTYSDVVRAANNGSDALGRVFVRVGHILGIGIAHLITLFDPRKIIITEKCIHISALILDEMYKTIDQYVSPKIGRRKIEIIVQELTEQDWARGAGAMVLQEFYKTAGRITSHHVDYRL